MSGGETISAVRVTTREIASSVVAEDVEAEDRGAEWPERSLRALAEAGLSGLTAPPEVGGRGLGLEALVVACEELGRKSPSTGLCFGMHCVGTAVIAAKATPDQRERYLEPIAAGGHITTLALSEPGTGSDFWIPRARVEASDKGLKVNGTKSFVTNGAHADSYVMSVAGVEEGGSEGTFSCIVVDADTEGMKWHEAWAGFGMRANSSRTVDLVDAVVPAENLLGEPGDQLWYLFEVIAPTFIAAMAGTYLGAAAEAVEIARSYVGSRRHDHTGELIGMDPVVGLRLGEMWTELDSARQQIYAGARRADRGDPDALLGMLGAKISAATASVRLVNEAMTLTGGRGYAANGPLGRLLRDVRASHVMAPTTDHLRVWIGRALLGLPLI